jgi:hypothetical protein
VKTQVAEPDANGAAPPIRQPFSTADRRLALAVIAIVVGCGIYVRLEFAKAFPQASLKLQLSRSEVTRRAEDFLRSRALSTAGFRQLTLFDPDETARLYLERELGLERANQLMEREVAVWRWRARWFRPPEKEEMLVWVSPEGRITGFEHILEEAARGARLSHEQALQVAQEFLPRFTSAPGRLVEDRLEQRPNRHDYLFTWEQEGFRANTATYRRTVVVQGDQVGRYLEYLYVPEAWRRDFSALRSRNDLFASIAQAFYLPLIIAGLVLLVRGLRRHEIPWRPVLHISGAVGVLMVISQLNSIPLAIDQYPTSSPYLQTLLLTVLQSLGIGVAVFFYVVTAAAGGEPIYRRSTGDPLSLRTAVTRDGASSRGFFRAVMAGYGMTAAHLAFLVAFYLVGRRFGAWSPQDVQYSDMLSTALPWIFPIAIGAMASTSEEFWFRLLAIPLLHRLLHRRWIAVLIPACVWGFLHANYPQQPAWIRGVEVGIIGIAAGVVMLRYGIVATLVWHYSVDALLIGANLFDAASWSYRASGGVVLLGVLAPLIVSLVLYRRNRGFVVLEEPEPQPEETVTLVVPPPAVDPVQPVWNIRWLYAAALAAGALALVLSPHNFGSWIRIRVTRMEAEAIARTKIPDADRWRATTDFIANLDNAEFEYLRRRVGAQEADRIVRERKATAVWRTRFFRPLEKEEWRIYMDQTGAVFRADHLLDERAPGARLTPDDAKTRAQATVPPSMMLVDWSEERRDNRTDYAFVFEDPSFRAGDARARVSLELHGDEPSNLRRFIKLPEEWLREFGKPRLTDFALPALIGSSALPLLIAFFRRLGSHETVFHWRAYAIAGAVALMCSLLSSANRWVTAMSGYYTATPEQNYVTQYVIGQGTIILLTAGAVFALVLAVDVFRQAAIGRAPLNTPVLLRTIAVAVLIAGITNLTLWLRGIVPGPRRSVPMWNVAAVDTWMPGLHAVTQGYLSAMLMTGAASLVAFAAVAYMRPRRRLIAAAVLVLAVALSRSIAPAEFAMNLLTVALGLGMILLIVKTCASDLMGFAVAIFWAVGLNAAWQFGRQPSPFLTWNGVVAAVLVVAAGVGVIRWMGRAAPSPPSQ